ncbi:MAG: hypothetical protein HRU75_02990 [Planctomycetia bacterium]|nr:MAG: hypothetical protein HRU75_02990 [Planctomycetia bacterium]
MHDGWNLIAEYDPVTLAGGDPTVLRQYMWGLDRTGVNGESPGPVGAARRA